MRPVITFITTVLFIALFTGCSSLPVPRESVKRTEPIAPEFITLWETEAQAGYGWVWEPETVARKLLRIENMRRQGLTDDETVAAIKIFNRGNDRIVVAVHIAPIPGRVAEEFSEIVLEKKLLGWYPVQRKWSGKESDKTIWNRGPF